MRALIELARQVGEKHSLDRLLTLVVTKASAELRCKHVSLRLLDASRRRLLVTARAARDVHTRGDVTFEIGEGLVGWVAKNVQAVRTGHATGDSRFVLRPDSQRKFESFLAVPLVTSGACIGVLSATDAKPDRFTEHDEDVLTLVAAICTPHLESARLARLASHDSLTGVLNRTGLDETLLGDHAVAPPFAVAMVDIDHFKKVNDRFGHAVGDEVLRQVAAQLTDGLRATDGVVRWGGEEFLVVLPGVAFDDARAIALRAWERLRGAALHTTAGDVVATVSIGLAMLRPGEDFQALVGRADRALYRAKNGGRDRVEIEPD
jgi:diguanylate cyclase (GGDEF)-like protein